MSQNNATTPYRTHLPNDYSSYGETSEKIPVGTTLSVAGALVSVARSRFYGPADNSINWRWVPIEGTAQEDPGKSSISVGIDVQGDNAEKDRRPVVLLGRGTMTNQKEMLDNKVGEARRTGKKLHYTMVYCPFNFTIRAHTKGVAEIIGNVLFEWLLFNQNSIEQYFQFRELGPFQLSRETPSQKQSDVWECRLDFRVAWELRWSHKPKAITLSELFLVICGTDDPSKKLSELDPNNDLLGRVAFSSMAHSPIT